MQMSLHTSRRRNGSSPSQTTVKSLIYICRLLLYAGALLSRAGEVMSVRGGGGSHIALNLDCQATLKTNLCASHTVGVFTPWCLCCTGNMYSNVVISRHVRQRAVCLAFPRYK